MVYDPHVRVTFKGFMGPDVDNPAEIWSTSLCLMEPTGAATGGLPSDSMLADISAAFNTYFRSGMRASNRAWYSGLRAALIGTDGHVVLDPDSGAYIQKDATLTSPSPGIASGAALPWQITPVLTLLTSRSGPTGRGRMYLPPIRTDLRDDGTLGDTAFAGLLANGAGFIGEINDLSPGTFRVGVASSKGYNTLVTRVQMGRVL